MKISFKQIVSTVWEYIIAFFYPPYCCCCGDAVGVAELICEDCFEELERLRIKTSRTLTHKGRKYKLNSIYMYCYDNAASSIVKRVKYSGKLSGTRFMGAMIAQKASRLSAKYDVVAYVPMTRLSEIKRGFNQDDYISLAVARKLGLRSKTYLVKCRNTKPQHRLTSGERRENLDGAFKARGNIKGKRILLIDDVITSGTTMCECADTLYRAGAADVTLVSFSMVRRGH